MRYRVGWFIPQEVMALTHLVPEVTQDDFSGIVSATNICLQQVQQPFSMIIDNRIIKNEQIVSLMDILQAMPQLRQSRLRSIIMILPRTVAYKATSMEMQRMEEMQLLYVESLTAAFTVLEARDVSLHWDKQIANFFAEDMTMPRNNP